MATELKRSVKTIILMHQICGKQIKKERLHDIVRCIEMLKAIEIQFALKKSVINTWVTLINRYTAEIIDQIIVKGIDQVGHWYNRGQFYEDMMFLLTTIYQSHQGGNNIMRNTVINHCFNLMTQQVFSEKELSEVRYLNHRLTTISNWEAICKKSTRCRFIYWLRSLFPYIFDMIMADNKRPNQLNYFLRALNDPLQMLWNVKHLESSYIAVSNYKKEIYRAFSDKVIKPICRKVEEEIRLQIHQAIIPGLS
jgi:WASH complex subunit 7